MRSLVTIILSFFFLLSRFIKSHRRENSTRIYEKSWKSKNSKVFLVKLAIYAEWLVKNTKWIVKKRIENWKRRLELKGKKNSWHFFFKMSIPVNSLYSLTWGDYGTSLVSAVQLLRCHGDLVDVTLAAEGRSFEAHKIVLCAASPYLLNLLKVSVYSHSFCLHILFFCLNTFEFDEYH